MHLGFIGYGCIVLLNLIPDCMEIVGVMLLSCLLITTSVVGWLTLVLINYNVGRWPQENDNEFEARQNMEIGSLMSSRRNQQPHYVSIAEIGSKEIGSKTIAK